MNQHLPAQALRDVLMKAAQPSRVDRFTERLDAKLAMLPDDETRSRFLAAQEAWWIAAYERFVTAIDMGELDPPPDGPDVHDYLSTIGVLNNRKAKFA